MIKVIKNCKRKNIKDCRIYFRCTSNEKEKIEKMAKELGLSVSQLILYCVNEGSSYESLKKFFTKVRS